MAAAAALATANAYAAPAHAAPINPGALGWAAASLADVTPAAIVCGRWRCWYMEEWGYGYRPWGYGYRSWGFGYHPWGSGYYPSYYRRW
jgi:hypothetical protein